LVTPAWGDRLLELGQAAGWNGRILAVPAGELPEDPYSTLDFSQDLVMDTRRIRDELGYAEVVAGVEGYRRTTAYEKLEFPPTFL
jgi:hypothetical protein